MEIVTSRLLPVPHAFTTRAGGVSEGAFSSLNLGFSTGDEPSRVEENLRRVAQRLEVPAHRLFTLSQLHGDVVLEAREEEGQGLAPILGEADAAWTDLAGSAVGVKTADCVPILLASEELKAVAAVHSGWRGTDLEIVRRAVQAMVREGARAESITAAIGPCIQACCYEVSPELAERFRANFGPEAVLAQGASSHLDLAYSVGQSLLRAGVAADRIDTLPECTFCDGRFFSHRRDRGNTGRQLSVAVCRF
ncbi:MAG: peptidoglycan editing factor PgeF [Myxococcota bacterium]|nr:peptidoglycan editing factor PgeF [Myxococcota bacterium]